MIINSIILHLIRKSSSIFFSSAITTTRVAATPHILAYDLKRR
jgi:hypothetical protein